MTWYTFSRILTVVMLVLLLASFFLPRARVAAGVLFLGVAAAGLVHRVIRLLEDSSLPPRITTLGLALFLSIGVAELVWGHRTIQPSSRRAA